MKLDPKWLIAAPALGALLVLGPMLQGRLGSTEPDQSSTRTSAQPKAGPPKTKVGSEATSIPDAWKVLTTMAGLLILGGVGIVALSRARKPRAQGGGEPLVALRQSLRLGPKSRLHAVQFDGHVLLLGEQDGSISMLREIEDPSAAADEAEILARDESPDGAEPRDLALLQAARRMAAAAASARPDRTGDRTGKRAPEKTVQVPRPSRPSAPAARSTKPAASNRALEEFHALLRKAKAEKAS